MQRPLETTHRRRSFAELSSSPRPTTLHDGSATAPRLPRRPWPARHASRSGSFSAPSRRTVLVRSHRQAGTRSTRAVRWQPRRARRPAARRRRGRAGRPPGGVHRRRGVRPWKWSARRPTTAMAPRLRSRRERRRRSARRVNPRSGSGSLSIVWFYDALPPSSLAEPPHVTAALLAVPTWVVVARVFPTDDGGPSPQGAITQQVLWPTHDKTYRRYRPTYG